MPTRLKKRQSAIIVICALLLAGCAPSLPEFKKDTLPFPKEFPDSRPNASNAVLPSWEDLFRDPTLASLIKLGIDKNQELRIVEQEIQISRSELMARQGEYLPKVDLAAGGGVEKVGDYTSEGVSDAANGLSENLPLYQLGLDATWEVDIWKRLRNASKAAYLRYLSSIEGRRFAVTELVAEIADDYFELQALDNELEIVDSYVGILDKIVTMVTLQQRAARVTSLPVKRFEAELFKNKARQVELRQKIVVTENHLNTLLGRFPEKVARDSQKFMSLELAPLDAGIPSRLLDDRPDVRAASFELEASKLSVAVAKARFYPALTIDAGVGFESFNISHFLEAPASLFYGVMGGLTAPLLNRSAIRAEYYTANSKQIQAVYRYEQTLVRAFTEVVNDMNRIKNLREVYDLKSRQADAMDEASRVSKILFQAARVDYVEALLTQREALDARIELVEAKKKLLGAYVSLYRALGGGWKGSDSASTDGT